MSSIVRLVLVVSIVGCISDKDVCAPWGLVEDRVMDRCVCPEGFVEADAGTCIGPDGGVIRFEIDPFRKHCLLNGLDDIGLTLEKAAAIDAFETRQKAAQPWL